MADETNRIGPGLAGHTGALDIEREERRRNGARSREPCLVHLEPRDHQRGLLSAGRSGVYPRPRLHRDRRPEFFSEEKRDAQSETTQVAPGVPGVPDSQHGPRSSLSGGEGGAHRPSARRRAAASSFRAAGGHDFGLPPVRSPRAAPRQPRRGNTAWVGDYKGVPMLFAQREAPRWRWPVRRRGSPDRWASSAPRTAGSELQRQQATDPY